MNWSGIREEFPALNRWTFLNTATFGQVPNRSKAALDRHFERRNEFACDDFINWFDDMDRIRASVGRLIGCEADDVAFIPNASAGISLLLSKLEWQPGDQIITLEDEFPNQLYFPAHLAARGVELLVVPGDELLEHVSERTRLVAVSTVNYSNGYTAPVQEIAAHLRKRGILFYLDGTQSVGALQFDAGAVQPDMLAVHCYKWMLSPNGAGFMYVSPSLRPKLEPAEIGWRSDRNWRSVDTLNHGEPEFSPTAQKYEGGMLNFAGLYAMGESLAMLHEIGPACIERRVLTLATRVRGIVERNGATVLHQGSPIIAAHFARHDAPQIAAELKQHGIIVAARQGNLRISPHFYNNEADLDRFEEMLTRIIQRSQ